MPGKHKKQFGTRFAVTRFARLAKALRAGEGFTATTIAKEFEVNPKTILRDLVYLRDRLGYQFEFKPRYRRWELIYAPMPVL